MTVVGKSRSLGRCCPEKEEGREKEELHDFERAISCCRSLLLVFMSSSLALFVCFKSGAVIVFRSLQILVKHPERNGATATKISRAIR